MAPKPSPDKEEPFEFFGPYLGPIGISVGLPAVCYLLLGLCNEDGCLRVRPSMWAPGLSRMSLFSWEAVCVVLAWSAFQIALHLALPGQRAQGVELRTGGRLTYKLTGIWNFWASIAVLAIGWFSGLLPLSWAYHHYAELLTASLFLALSVSLLVYASALMRRDSMLPAAAARPEYRLYTWFLGYELNPRVGAFDLKQFFEQVPGLVGWVALDLACAAAQWEERGRLTPAMAAVCAFHTLYVWDSLHHEPAILTTMDITTDGFGFMLAFADFAWVPFTYSLQARLAVHWVGGVGWLGAALVAGLNMWGYLVFRRSNSIKDGFRKDPQNPAYSSLRLLPTKRGTKLIVSGWWGMCRHPNYLGDWLMGLAWCLPLGTQSIVPYFYAIYFAVLLLHRAMRDDHACQRKYGDDWDVYCRLVRWKIVPLVY
ncbi:ERG4/ERG24 ergosterol biosynthesis protein [Helicosporidium sp. ATCC 50920]|nr:ERG4/ERG24 ergosterol biosynthesis protein [Helicosporidium sp. ATCC 50920]|eukprot:KDD77053.1 ERG4/ERG24 ergosterol biosynthesis protein [Helicosporidium sp. ATCC 50920]